MPLEIGRDRAGEEIGRADRLRFAVCRGPSAEQGRDSSHPSIVSNPTESISKTGFPRP